MWLRFSFTACSARGTKLAPITGTRSALQYCFTLACSSASVAGFIAAPPPPRLTEDRSCSSPATGVRSVPGRPQLGAPPEREPVLQIEAQRVGVSQQSERE